MHYEAEKLFEEFEYWECAKSLLSLKDFYPEYSKIDEVYFLLGSSFYEIGLLEGAAETYKFLIKKHIRSKLLPNALVGLQRIEHDKENHSRSLEYHKAIIRGNPSIKVKDESFYYAGQSLYKQNKFIEAIKMMNNISLKSEMYPFGQYTSALSMLRIKRVRQSIETFNKVIQLPVTTELRRHIIDETHITLGYIFYEIDYFQQALKQFNSVSENHQGYQNALLAAGWSAANLQDYETAINPLTDLVTKTPENELFREGFFLLGRCYLKLNMYTEAIKIYDHLLEILPEKPITPEMVERANSIVANEEKRLEKMNMDLLMLESQFLDKLQYNIENNAPVYLQSEQDALAKQRNSLFNKIQNERVAISGLSNQIDDLKRQLEMNDKYNDWRAYSEYGRSRAVFMKAQKEKRAK